MLLLYHYQGPISFINQNHRQPRKSFPQNFIGSIDLVYWYIRYPWERERAGRECFFVLFGFYSNTYSYMATCIWTGRKNLLYLFLLRIDCKFNRQISVPVQIHRQKYVWKEREREWQLAGIWLFIFGVFIGWERKKNVGRYRESDTERKTRLLFNGLVFYLII